MKKCKLIPLAAALLALATALSSCDAAPGRANDVFMDEAYAEDAFISNGEKPEVDGITGGSLQTPNQSESSNGDYDRKIIRTVKMACETKAYDQAISTIMAALSAQGGYVEASTTTGVGYESTKGAERRATYTLRVPAEHLDSFLETLRTDEGIRILSQNATSDEITAAYYDTVSRLETLNAEKASLTAMLEGFTDYNDISAMLQVQERLYNVIEEIEALQTRLNLFDGQVAMSTVYLTLDEVITYTAPVAEEPTFGERITRAFTESWKDFGEGCQDFAVGFVESLPTLLVLAVIGGGIAVLAITLVRKSNKKRRAEQEALNAMLSGRSEGGK